MSNLVPTPNSEKGHLSPILHGKTGGLSPPIPFSKPIFLLETYVAGTSHVDNINEIVKLLKIGDRLRLIRDINNDYDSNAIIVKTLQGEKLGFVPQNKNEILSKLLDGGKLVDAQIIQIEPKEHWIKITIKIYLKD